MKNLKEYKQKIKNLFFLSIRCDLENWKFSSYSKEYYSKNHNGYYFHFDNKSLYIYRESNGESNGESINMLISNYKWNFLILDFKVYYYILLLKYKLKQIETNKKNNIEITFLKNAITKLENVYISDLSKIKIKQL